MRVVVDDVDSDLSEDRSVKPHLLLVGHLVIELYGLAHQAQQERNAFLRDRDAELALTDQALGIIYLRK